MQMELLPKPKYQISDRLKEQLGSWTELYPFFETEEWQKIKSALKEDINQLTPEIDVWFRAFKECQSSNLKVVWLGLSPYFNKDMFSKKNVADGLAFSTNDSHIVPPSLFQVYKGLEWDKWGGMNLNMTRSNNLQFLANQGVLLLNSALTTVYGSSDKHIKIWEPFISYVINVLNKRSGLIFVGFGQVANELLTKVDRTKHIVFEREHPAAAARNSRMWRHDNLFTKLDEELKRKDTQIFWDKHEIDIKVPF